MFPVTRVKFKIVLSLFLLTQIIALVNAQMKPPTIELKPVHIGEEFSFPLSDFLRGGIGKKTFELGGDVPNLRLTADQVKNPDGSLRDVVLLKGIPETAQDKPYEFSVTATDSRHNKVVLLFSLKVLPFGANFDSARDLIAAITPAKLDTCKPVISPFIMATSTSDEETIGLTQSLIDFSGYLNPVTLQITDPAALMTNTIKSDGAAQFQKGDYVVVHIIRWKDLKEGKSDPEREAWALFEKVDGATEWEAHIDPKDPEKKAFDNRIFGSRRVFALAIHLNTPVTWDIKYKVTINRKVPQPVANLMQLAATLQGGEGVELKCTPPTVKNIWGARLMLFKYVASDMVVKVNTITSDTNGQQVEQAKEYTKTYDNEGRYHWDVSIGIPLKSIKELEFSVENNGTKNSVTAKEKNRENAYGFLNLFPKAVDLKGDSFLTTPHFLVGVPLTGKPLDRPMIGLGTGIYKDAFKVNIFAGVVFNRVTEPRTLQVGDAATPFQLENDLRTKRVTKFIFGVNFPLRQALSSLK